MNIVAWNVRGLNATNKHFEVFKFLNKFRPSMVGLLENKLTNDKIIRLKNSLPNNWNVLDNNSTGSKGRILIVWDSNVWKLKVDCTSYQHMSVTADNAGGLSCRFTFIYASNFLFDREKLWTDLINESHLVDIP